jgi:hypothetical protein
VLFIEKEVKPDKTPPIISNIEIKEITYTSVTITWRTNEPTDSFVENGKTTDYGNFAGNPKESKTFHSVTLTSLIPSTTYHFRVLGKDSYGNLGHSSDKTFTTLGITPETEKVSLEKLPEEEKKALETVQKGSQTFIREILKVLPRNPHLHAIPEEAFISSITEITPKVVSPPQIGGTYPQVKVGPDWAEITWLTDKKSNSLVAYAKEGEYNPEKEEP